MAPVTYSVHIEVAARVACGDGSAQQGKRGETQKQRARGNTAAAPGPRQRAISIHVGHNVVRHLLAVRLPRLAVLGGALVLVAALAVDEQHGKVHGVEVRDGGNEACIMMWGGVGDSNNDCSTVSVSAHTVKRCHAPVVSDMATDRSQSPR